MKSENYSKYLKCMELIKARIAIIDQINNKEFTSNISIIDNEILCIQYRIIFELIAMSSLCGHQESYEKIRASFNKEWRISKIIKTIESINPKFFPFAFEDNKIDSEGKRIMTKTLKNPLTKEELIKYHGMSGNYLHQKNPFDNDETENPFIGNAIRNKIVYLLNKHRVWLYHESQMIIVLLNTIPTGKATLYPCEPI